MTTFPTIAAAAAHSREYDTIGYVHEDDFELALDELQDAVGEGQRFDYVENGHVLEFWAFEPETDDDSMTMRVHVIRST